MQIEHVTLTETERQAIQALSEHNGMTQEEIVHEAIEQFLSQHESGKRLAVLRSACGLWQERDDLPDLSELREEWDRS